MQVATKWLIGLYVALLLIAAGVATFIPGPDDSTERAKLGAVFVAAVSGFMAFVASARAAARSEGFQVQLARHKETAEMWTELFGAASAYYRALQFLEHGELDKEQCRAAETRLNTVEGWLVHLPSKQLVQSVWDIWQDFRRVAEHVNTLADVEAKKTYWTAEAAGLGQRLDTLRVDLARASDDLLKRDG